MNAADLLDQFIQESREGLEQIGQRLLDVERDPGNAGLLNDLFRQVHTLKGNCGLFDFKALETVVHAGEDLLDRVRNGSLAYNGAIADALLAAMDYTAELVDAIAQDGTLPASAAPRAQALGCGTAPAPGRPGRGGAGSGSQRRHHQRGCRTPVPAAGPWPSRCPAGPPMCRPTCSAAA